MNTERFDAVISAESAQRMRELLSFDVDIHHRAGRKNPAGGYSVAAILTRPDIDRLVAAGYTVETVRGLSSVEEDRRSLVSPDNRLKGGGVSLTVSGYLTNEEIDSAMSSLAASHPSIATRIALPNKTWEGRTSYAMRLRAGTKPSRPAVLFTGGMHAREWGGSDICVAFMTQMVNAYVSGAGLSFGGKLFSAAQVKSILENLDVFVFPNVNPDGKHHSQFVDMWWRKNRNPNGGGPAGVDLNRNFDFLWSSGIGTSASVSSDVYKGTSAFSEPESRNVRYLFDTYASIRFYCDIHSYSQLMLYSWGDDDNQNTTVAQNFLNGAFDGMRGTASGTYKEFIPTLDENTLNGIGKRMKDALSAVRGKSYALEQSVGLYPTSGTTGDYAFSRHIANPSLKRVYGYTIEFGTEFIPPIAEMNLIKTDVNSAMTELCLAACSDIFMKDNPADTGAVPVPSPFWDSSDIWVRNSDDGGIAHQNTVRGKDNYMYIRVRNRGLADAKNLTVRAYITSFAGTEFVHPEDWVPLNPAGGGGITALGTYLIGETSIASLAASGSQIVKILWQKSLIPADASWHPCILTEVSPNDGPAESGSHVWDNNNLAQKNITIVNALYVKKFDFPFFVGSDKSPHELITLEIRKVKTPAPVGIALTIDPQSKVRVKGCSNFRPKNPNAANVFLLDAEANVGRILLVPGKARRFPITVSVDKPDSSAKQPYRIEVVQLSGQEQIVGGVAYIIDTAGKKPAA